MPLIWLPELAKLVPVASPWFSAGPAVAATACDPPPPLPPVCVVSVLAARLAAAAMVMLPLVPLTVLVAPLMLGLQPPPYPLEPSEFATTGVAKATTRIAIVRRTERVKPVASSVLSLLTNPRVVAAKLTEPKHPELISCHRQDFFLLNEVGRLLPERLRKM